MAEPLGNASRAGGASAGYTPTPESTWPSGEARAPDVAQARDDRGAAGGDAPAGARPSPPGITNASALATSATGKAAVRTERAKATNRTMNRSAGQMTEDMSEKSFDAIVIGAGPGRRGGGGPAGRRPA